MEFASDVLRTVWTWDGVHMRFVEVENGEVWNVSWIVCDKCENLLLDYIRG